MAGEDDGDAHTLGLLLDMRELCTRIAEEHHGYAAQLHDLVRQIQNPNVHGLDKEMGFRIEDIGDGELPSITPEQLPSIVSRDNRSRCPPP